MSRQLTGDDSPAGTGAEAAAHAGCAEPEAETAPQAGGEGAAGPEPEPAAPQPRRPRPSGARCDACHERGARVVRSRDGLLTVCMRCARGVDVSTSDSADAITAVVNRAPIGERRLLTRRLLARRALHTARRDRKLRPS